MAAAAAAAPSSTTPDTADQPTAAAAVSDVSRSAGSTAISNVMQSRFGHPLLPRMPLSLQYLISSESYRAAAAVARALGRGARLVDLGQQQQWQQQQQQHQFGC